MNYQAPNTILKLVLLEIYYELALDAYEYLNRTAHGQPTNLIG